MMGTLVRALQLWPLLSAFSFLLPQEWDILGLVPDRGCLLACTREVNFPWLSVTDISGLFDFIGNLSTTRACSIQVAHRTMICISPPKTCVGRLVLGQQCWRWGFEEVSSHLYERSHECISVVIRGVGLSYKQGSPALVF